MNSETVDMLARHGAIKPEHVTRYLEKTNGFIDSGAFRIIDDHVGFDSNHLNKIVRNEDNHTLTYLAAVSHPNADHEAHNFALQNRHQMVGLEATRKAKHPSTLELAATHYDPIIRKAAAFNENTPDHILSNLEKDSNPDIAKLATKTKRNNRALDAIVDEFNKKQSK